MQEETAEAIEEIEAEEVDDSLDEAQRLKKKLVNIDKRRAKAQEKLNTKHAFHVARLSDHHAIEQKYLVEKYNDEETKATKGASPEALEFVRRAMAKRPLIVPSIKEFQKTHLTEIDAAGNATYQDQLLTEAQLNGDWSPDSAADPVGEPEAYKGRGIGACNGTDGLGTDGPVGEPGDARILAQAGTKVVRGPNGKFQRVAVTATEADGNA